MTFDIRIQETAVDYAYTVRFSAEVHLATEPRPVMTIHGPDFHHRVLDEEWRRVIREELHRRAQAAIAEAKLRLQECSGCSTSAA